MMPPVRRNRQRIIIDIRATKCAIAAGKLSAADCRTVGKFLPGLIVDTVLSEAIKAHLAYPGDEDHGA